MAHHGLEPLAVLPDDHPAVPALAEQGAKGRYLEEHGRVERRYRAGSINELMRIGITEVRADADLGQEEAALLEAIREACFEAEDAEHAIVTDE